MPALLQASLLLLAAAPPPARAPAVDVKTVVKNALAAAGGAAALAKHPAWTFQAKAIFRTPTGQAIGCTVVGSRFGADRSATAVAVETADSGIPQTRALVIDRDKGWLALDGVVQALSAAELAEEKERLSSAWLITLLPLREPGVELSALPASTVGKRAAVGLLVRQKGRRDVKLSFDAATWLLVKRETVIQEGGKAVLEEILFAGHRKANGVAYAGSVRVLHGGRRVLDLEMTRYTPRATLADSVFARPQP